MEKKKVKLNSKINTGFIARPPKREDWIASKVSGLAYEEILKDGNWEKYLPTEEKQSWAFFDSMGCVSFSCLNVVEMQINRLIKEKIIDTEPIKDWLDENGLFNGSDRFLVKMSGTSNQGNGLQEVAEALRKNGVCPEKDWPAGETFNHTTYFAEITQAVKDKAKKFLDYFNVQYEWIGNSYLGWEVSKTNVVKHLKQAPIQIASPTCPPWADGIIKRCSLTQATHATSLFNYLLNNYFGDFDHYDPYKKKLAWNYLLNFAMKILIIPKSNILKKNTMPKLYKQKNDNAVYQLGADSLYHPIANESFVKNLYGDWKDLEVKELEYIDKSKIGSMIGEINWALSAINNLFKKQI